MNMQALMKQAQAMQKEITSIKNKIDETIYVGNSSLVSVSVKGTKEIIKIDFLNGASDLASDDMTMLGDMIMIAINDAFKKVDDDTQQKMGKYSSMMNGLM